MSDTEKIFSEIGGQFITPFSHFAEKVKKVRALIFDWDGVFNDGSKLTDEGSSFAEPDAMGMNMFKLDYWLRNKELPFTFIITGENNRFAAKLCRREFMNGVFLGCKNKTEAMDIICESHGISDDEIAFVYDDILDAEVAKRAGVSLLVDRAGSPVMKRYFVSNGICDYITGNPGGRFAVREVCEMLVSTNGDLYSAIETRIEFTGAYQEYLKARNKIEVAIF